jgi:hypothetical protein
MSTKINVRSPYYVKVSNADLHSVTLRLYVWTGETTDPNTLRYTFTKTEIGTNNYVVFELSEYIKDFLVTDYGSYSTDIVWVKYDYQIYNSSGGAVGSLVTSSNILGVDGYGYFEDGANPQLSQQLLQSNTILYYNQGQDIVFPVWAEFEPTITLTSDAGANVLWEAVEDFWNLYDVSWGYAVTPIDVDDDGNTNQKIQYIRITLSEELQDGDTITITSAGGGTTTITLEEVCEPKYSPINVIFYNKFGALQNIWFFKKSVTTLGTVSENYKANIMNFDSTPTYSTTSPQYQVFNKQGRENIRCSTGFIDEQYNEVIKQLMLSEQVWIDNGTDVLPVAVASNSLEFKTGVNDKLIDYTIEFQYAFDKINNIR